MAAVGKVSEEEKIPAPLADVWDLYFDPKVWPAWVDQFHAVDTIEPPYPEEGGRLVWHSGQAGRGQVTETVIEHEHRRLHRIRFADPASEGELLTTFEIDGDGTKVKLDLVYGLLQPGFFGPITDRLFVRSQMASSLSRSLSNLCVEAIDRPPAACRNCAAQALGSAVWHPISSSRQTASWSLRRRNSRRRMAYRRGSLSIPSSLAGQRWSQTTLGGSFSSAVRRRSRA